jgi:hypothetical protein
MHLPHFYDASIIAMRTGTGAVNARPLTKPARAAETTATRMAAGRYSRMRAKAGAL